MPDSEKKPWGSSHEILKSIYAVHDLLKEGKIDASTAHAHARLFNGGIKLLAVSLEHAHLTQRLSKGIGSLPVMNIDDGAAASTRLPTSKRARKRLADSTEAGDDPSGEV